MQINKNLITLKCVLFLFFGAIGSLFPFLPLHMNTLGLSKDESTIISIVAPIVALLGPLVAAPVADRLAGGFGGASRSKTGRYLRVMIALCLAFATILYWLLLTIPPIYRSPPNVSFACDEEGGWILQDRCGAERTCYDWGSETGTVQVKNCIFSCNATTLYRSDPTNPPQELTAEYSTEEYYDEPNEVELEFAVASYPPPTTAPLNTGIVPMPHMCHHTATGDLCEVYTEHSHPINFTLSLRAHAAGNDSPACRYPFGDRFHCRITNQTRAELADADADCAPVVLCELHDPYNNTNSLLRRSQCGYDNISFWLYLFIRSAADVFPAAAVTLISTAIVIATRETSTGRGDIGKQLAAGAVGFALFPPLVGGLANGVFLPAMITFTVLMVLAILVLLFDNKMPLSPPEWWWHTRCGLLALPMSSVRKYTLEIVALGLILLTLGVFWNAIDTFLPWHLIKLAEGTPLIIGLTLTIGAIPAIVVFIFAEKIVDYCSHSNILMLCFVNYIVHHVALVSIESAPVLLIFEILEIFTLHLMYVTVVLYLRHLVPRKLTACGQALPIIAHFCLGRCFGALIGSLAYTEYPQNFRDVHEGFAIAAAVIACFYFLAYHFYLKPKCGAQTQLPPYPAPSVVQNMNGNGSYTPLRVYHNGRAKKGHFRY